jgi:hypothetical protein
VKKESISDHGLEVRPGRMPGQHVRRLAHQGEFGMPEQPIGQRVGCLRQAERINPFLRIGPAAADLVKHRHGTLPVGVPAIGLRFTAEIFRNFGDEGIRFIDAAIDLRR